MLILIAELLLSLSFIQLNARNFLLLLIELDMLRRLVDLISTWFTLLLVSWDISRQAAFLYGIPGVLLRIQLIHSPSFHCIILTADSLVLAS